MKTMFNSCSALTSLDLSNFNTQYVMNMGGMFSDCSALQSINLSSFNTENVTYMGLMFTDCKALTSIDLSSFNTGNVTDMSLMFSDCEALQSIDLSNFNTGNAIYMYFMFTNCKALTTIYCNNTWTCSGSSEWMFGGCTQLVGAVAFDENKTDVAMANPETGYFTKKATDGIESATADVSVRKQGTYNLQGVRMADDFYRLPAGIYIVDGEKVVKK